MTTYFQQDIWNKQSRSDSMEKLWERKKNVCKKMFVSGKYVITEIQFQFYEL